MKWLIVIALLTHGSLYAGDWFTTDGGKTYCKTISSQPFLMNDSQACGSRQMHCIAPIQCVTWGFFKTTGIISCRARTSPQSQITTLCDTKDKYAGVSALSKCGDDDYVMRSANYDATHFDSYEVTPSCPSDYQCAMDPQPKLLRESEAWRWSYSDHTLPSYPEKPSPLLQTAQAHHK